MKKILAIVIALSIGFLLMNCSTNNQNGPRSGGNVKPAPSKGAEVDKATNEPEPTKTEVAEEDKGADHRFEDYPVSEIFEGKTPKLTFTSETQQFRSRLTEAAKGKPNFAGRYIVAQWGCGADCVTGGVIDAKTGNTYEIPVAVCCWDGKIDENFKPIEFRENSNLIIFRGLLGEEESDSQIHYYKFENNKFVPVKRKSRT